MDLNWKHLLSKPEQQVMQKTRLPSRNSLISIISALKMEANAKGKNVFVGSALKSSSDIWPRSGRLLGLRRAGPLRSDLSELIV